MAYEDVEQDLEAADHLVSLVIALGSFSKDMNGSMSTEQLNVLGHSLDELNAALSTLSERINSNI